MTASSTCRRSSSSRHSFPVRSFDRALSDGRSIRVRTTDRSDGDFAVTSPPGALEARRRAIVDRPWVWLNQVHGDRCVSVDLVGMDGAIGASADASTTASSACALSIQTADCVPIALWTDDGVIGAAHVGWRGLEAGVLDGAVDSLRTATATIHAFIGPSIGPECYEFGMADLDRLAARYGSGVRSTTIDGRPALDVRVGVRCELERLAVVIDAEDDSCTACDDRYFSHRGAGDDGRQAMVIWIEES